MQVAHLLRRVSSKYFVSDSDCSNYIITRIFLSWKRSGKPSAVASINGAIAGLAGVTAALGYMSVQNSLILGLVVDVASFYAITLIKEKLKIDDTLDVSSVHGITGIIDTLSLGFIASSLINSAGLMASLW